MPTNDGLFRLPSILPELLHTTPGGHSGVSLTVHRRGDYYLVSLRATNYLPFPLPAISCYHTEPPGAAATTFTCHYAFCLDSPTAFLLATVLCSAPYRFGSCHLPMAERPPPPVTSLPVPLGYARTVRLRLSCLWPGTWVGFPASSLSITLPFHHSFRRLH